MGSVQCLVLAFFSHFSKVDRNKGDIRRKVCMESVELKRIRWTAL